MSFFGGGYGSYGGGFGGNRRFEEQYHCYSVAYADKPHLEVRSVVYHLLLSRGCVSLIDCPTIRMREIPFVHNVSRDGVLTDRDCINFWNDDETTDDNIPNLNRNQSMDIKESRQVLVATIGV